MTRRRTVISWQERIEQISTSVVTAVVLAFGGAISWVVRTLLTSQKKIAMLEREISHRDKLREEDRAQLADVRDGVKRIETVLLGNRK